MKHPSLFTRLFDVPQRLLGRLACRLQSCRYVPAYQVYRAYHRGLYRTVHRYTCVTCGEDKVVKRKRTEFMLASGRVSWSNQPMFGQLIERRK